MVKKKTKGIIILILIVVFIIMNQTTFQKESIRSRDSLDNCESSRDYDDAECKGECTKITQSIANCLLSVGSTYSGTVGRYAYFYDNSDSCSKVISGSSGEKDKYEWLCMYNQLEVCSNKCTPGLDECYSNGLRHTCVDLDHDSCYEWSDPFEDSSCIKSCIDSDDGQIATIKGTVTTDASQGCENGCTDYCDTPNPTRVVEFWCESTTTKASAIFLDCQNGCSDGKCIGVPLTCSTLDGTCKDNQCDQFEDCSYLGGSCSTGICCEGTCTKGVHTCIDTDDPDGDILIMEQRFTEGSVTSSISGTFSDKCESNTKLTEYICKADKSVGVVSFTCDCQGNVCKEATNCTDVCDEWSECTDKVQKRICQNGNDCMTEKACGGGSGDFNFDMKYLWIILGFVAILMMFKMMGKK